VRSIIFPNISAVCLLPNAERSKNPLGWFFGKPETGWNALWKGEAKRTDVER
jgi:hypothetical protein